MTDKVVATASVEEAGGMDRMYVDGTYKNLNPDWHTEDSEWKATQIVRMTERNKLAVSRVAEIGCGAGEILRQLSLKWHEVQFFGYELSPDALGLCAARRSDRIHFFQEDVLKSGETFDLMLCIDVLEHIDDYMGFLRGLRESATLKIIHIPLDIYVLSVLRKTMMSTRKWVGHLHYFTKETALATLQDCGYTVLDHFYTKSFDGAPSKSIEARLMRLPRRTLSAVAPDFAQTWLGGCSLLVLAR
jgi:2-polyprenyl-3-methyl-5-hydroxy-6-metoxy-1,4-benzoquinol methylase